MEISLAYQAEIALNALSQEDKMRVGRSLEQLTKSPLEALSLEQFENTYLLRVTPKLRLLFQKTASHLEVLDIFTHERLEYLYVNNAVAA
jgi:hypothetical protein